MTKIIYGDRLGKTAALMVGCSAVIFDETRRKILLTRRADNGRWCLPGGRMEPGESAAEACTREVGEETGLEVRIERLIGVYTSPHHLIAYADGHRFQLVAFNFEAAPIGGTLGLSHETTEVGYFAPAEIKALDLMDHHRERIEDALAGQTETFFR